MVPRAGSRSTTDAPGPPQTAAPQSKPRASSPFSYRSFEADDERSTASSLRLTDTMGPSMQMDHGGDDDDSLPPPSYPGDDTRSTSRKELLGFYAYSFAAEVFVVCGLGAFIPITLEELARASASAVLADDHSTPCRSGSGIPEAMRFAARDDLPLKHGGEQCVFRIFGHEVNTASFAMYTFSVSVLIQSLLVVTMSGAADHGRYRKTLLLTFATTGAIATMLFLPVTPAVYLLGSLWAIISNVCFGASFVLLNSFLPLLVRHHADVRRAHANDDPETHFESDEVSATPTTWSSPPCPRPCDCSATTVSETYSPETGSSLRRATVLPIRHTNST